MESGGPRRPRPPTLRSPRVRPGGPKTPPTAGRARTHKKMCAVAACPNPERGVVYHGFPKEPERRRRWLALTGRTRPVNPLTAKICARHFSPDDYVRDVVSELYPSLRPRLKADARPSLHLRAPAHETRAQAKLRVAQSRQLQRADIPSARTDPSPLLANFLALPLGPPRTIGDQAGVPAPAPGNSAEVGMAVDPSPALLGTNESWTQCRPPMQNAQVECKIEKGFLLIQRENAALRAQLSAQKTKTLALKREIGRLKSEKYKRELIMNVLEKMYSAAQTRKILKQNVSFVRNYDDRDYTTGLVLRAISKRAYDFMRAKTCLAIPSRGTLAKWLDDFKCDPGIQIDCLRAVHDRLAQSPAPGEKLVALSFGAMDLRRKSGYDKKTRKTYGPNKKLQVVMIRGITHAWKQLVFFSFDATMNKSLFERIVKVVEQEAGVEIWAVAFDLNQHKFISDMNFSEDQYWIPSPADGSRKIFALPDPARLLKLCRNDILDDGLRLPPHLSSTLSKQDFLDLKAVNASSFNSSPNITSLHLSSSICDRQKTMLAAQLLSRTNARAFEIVFGSAKLDQAQAVNRINAWFDLANSSQVLVGEPAKCAFGVHFDVQIQILRETKTFLETSEVVDKPRRPWQTGMLMNINALCGLYEELKDHMGITFLLTSYLNLELLDNVFAQVRALVADNNLPTSLEALKGIRLILIGKDAAELLLSTPTTEEPTTEMELINETHTEPNGLALQKDMVECACAVACIWDPSEVQTIEEVVVHETC
eukprot:maker-scaffold660_size117387-snap-gene-0.24 protein:Tk06668 transcript:maker-scaffold660_size117387-snap-gene-0.24-mRNA-1 annotation:"truncated transposase"